MSTPALEAVRIAKNFGGVTAVDNVSFAVAPGSLSALIGPNGAGKTTVFNMVTNLFPPSSGEVRFFGADLAGLPPHRIAALGLVRTFQAARVFPGMTTLENVLSGAHMHLRAGAVSQMIWSAGARREERALVAKAEALLDLVGLSAFRDVAATELPMGTQKLLEVIRAVMARPRMLLLDEPAAGLNDSETAELAALLIAIREGGVTIFVVEHNMSLVMGIADQVIVLDAGSIVAAGAPVDIQRNARVIEAYIGAEAAHA
ncbi:MAG: ABC transporter ATP-binding protein [Xanthobacteraceae bacterium]